MKAAEAHKAGSKLGLEEIRDTARIRAEFNSFIVSNEGELRGLVRSSYLKEGLLECIKYREIDTSVAYRGLLVQACSIFEIFNKHVIASAIDEIVQEASTRDQLGWGFVVRNFMTTAQYIKTSRDKFYEGKDSPRVIDAVRTLMSLADPADKPEFNSFTFVHDMGNCNVKTFESYYETALLKNPLSEISKTNALKNHYNTRSAADAKSEAIKYLNETMKRRNRIVHENCMSESIVLQDIEDACGFFGAMMEAVDEWLQGLKAKDLLV